MYDFTAPSGTRLLPSVVTSRAFLSLVSRDAQAADFAELLASEVLYEALNVELAGRDAVAERLGQTRYNHLEWKFLDGHDDLLAGTPRPGSSDRGIVIKLQFEGAAIVRISQQGITLPHCPQVS